MATKGQLLSNPITGDSFEFIETAKDTNGARVTLRATVKSKGQLVPNHLHLLQDESFEILSGELTVTQGGKTVVLKAGDKLTHPKNTAHNHYNNSDTEVTYIHTVAPALDFDHFIENLIGLAADGKSKNGKYGLLQDLTTLKYLDSKAYLADMPIGVQKVLMETVAPIARLMGYRAIYKKYSGFDK